MNGEVLYFRFQYDNMKQQRHIDRFVHDCSNLSAVAMELLQSCTQDINRFVYGTKLTLWYMRMIATWTTNYGNLKRNATFSNL